MRNCRFISNKGNNIISTLALSVYKSFIKQGVQVSAIDVAKVGFPGLMLNSCTACQIIHIILMDNESKELVMKDLPQNVFHQEKWIVIWLTLTPVHDSDIRNLFNTTYLPYNSRVHIAIGQYQVRSSGKLKIINMDILEVYQVSVIHPLTLNRLVLLSPSNVDVPLYMNSDFKGNINIWKRRRNLQNLILKTVSMQSLHERINGVYKNNEMSPGYFKAIWEELQNHLNFSTEHITMAGVLPGARLLNGSWGGTLTRVVSGQADIALAVVPVLATMAEHVDFTTSISRKSYSMFIQKFASECVDWSKFWRPYDYSIWLTLTGVLLGVALLLAWLCSAGELLTGTGRSSGCHMSEALHMTLSAVCQQGYPQPPCSLSARGVFVVVFLLGIILNAVYSSVIVSVLAVSHTELPFSSLTELLHSNTDRLELVEGSASVNIFQESQDPILRWYWRKKKAKVSKSVEESFENICKVSKDSENLPERPVLYFISSWAAFINKMTKCHLTEIPTDYNKFWLALPVAKGLPYRDLLNHYLYKLRESGILQKMTMIFTVQEPLETEKIDLPSVELGDVAFIFFLLILGYCSALVLLIAELLIFRFHHFYTEKLQYVPHKYFNN